MSAIRFDVIHPRTKRQSQFTGVFKDKVEADEWYNKYGKEWEQKGRILVKVKLKKKSSNGKK